MDVLLGNNDKSTWGGAVAGKRIAIDVSKLDACFGGFTPMALSDGLASAYQVEIAQRRAQERREFLDRAAEIEAARASEERVWTDESDTAWTYVVLDDKEVSIRGCSSQAAHIDVPSSIESLPVIALGDEACSNISSAKEIVCPDCIVVIGYCAFRNNKNLRVLVFPSQVATFDRGWIRGCDQLETLVLPGNIEILDASVFEIPTLKQLVIGAGTSGIEPGMFGQSNLEVLSVNEQNPFLETDGSALYTHGGETMLALAVPRESYTVIDTCKALAKKACSMLSCLKELILPDTFETMGPFACAATSITSFIAPRDLANIGEKAFFNCASLTHVRLNEGLAHIGQNAFTATSIESLHLPASLKSFDYPIADRTALTCVGRDATFTIDKACAALLLDEQGGLYQKKEDGLHFVRLIDRAAKAYSTNSQTVVVEELAFFNHKNLTSICFNQGLRAIKHGACKGCRLLTSVDIPDTVEEIGYEAFLDTALTSFDMPAGLSRLGENALVTYGSHHGNDPSLTALSLEGGNEYFSIESGMLIEKNENAGDCVLLYLGGVEDVIVPERVTSVAPYAFNGAKGIRTLHLRDSIREVGMRGLAVSSPIDCIYVDTEEPIEGRTHFELRYPATERGLQQMILALGVPDHVDISELYAQYDHAIVNASSFDAKSDEALTLYDQAHRIIDRLCDPIFMTTVNRSLCERVLKNNLEDICLEMAKHDDVVGVDTLVDLGFLNADTIYPVIERVGSLRDAAMMGHLLEIKRLRFGAATFDFDL